MARFTQLKDLMVMVSQWFLRIVKTQKTTTGILQRKNDDGTSGGGDVIMA